MKNKFLITTWILILQFSLYACAVGKPEHPIKLNSGYINQQIVISAPKEYNTFSNTDAVFLEVQYNSDYEIIFPSNYNVRIFKLFENNWVELEELPIIRSPDNIVFSPKTEGIQYLAVEPALNDYTLDYELRFYIFGEMKTNEGTKEVSAYVDVNLHP